MTPPLRHNPAPANPSQDGRLALDFAHRHGATILSGRRHQGPLRLLRPFYPEGKALCHAAILHPPGGLVGGDSLHLMATLAEGCGVLLTTPAAGKVYRSAAGLVRQRTELTIAGSSSLEWLPHEQILYDGAQLEQHTHIRLESDSMFMGWELSILGRPGSGEQFCCGSWSNTIQVDLAQQVLFLDIMRLEGGSPLCAAPWGLGGARVLGTWLAWDPAHRLLDALRAALDSPQPDHWWAATHIQQLVVLRYLGSSLREARALFEKTWQLARPLLLGRPPCTPRLWAT